MLTVRPLAEEQTAECLALLRQESERVIEPALAVMGLDWGQFERLFHETGEVYGVYLREEPPPGRVLPGVQAEALAGFYWIETRGTVLHLHALILKPEYQGRGIGSQVMAGLAAAHPAGVTTIELGVYEANPRARAFYERLGFELVKALPDAGFAILRKEI